MVTETNNPEILVNENKAPYYCIWLQTDTVDSIQIYIWDGSQFQTQGNIDLKVSGVFEPHLIVRQHQKAVKVANLLDVEGTITVIGLTKFKR